MGEGVARVHLKSKRTRRPAVLEKRLAQARIEIIKIERVLQFLRARQDFVQRTSQDFVRWVVRMSALISRKCITDRTASNA